MAKGMKPRAEQSVGEKINILGVDAYVVDVVPETDWSWRVTLSSINGGGAAEKWDIIVPTDYNTTTNNYAWK